MVDIKGVIYESARTRHLQGQAPTGDCTGSKQRTAGRDSLCVFRYVAPRTKDRSGELRCQEADSAKSSADFPAHQMYLPS